MQSPTGEPEQKFVTSRPQSLGASVLGVLAIAALVALRPNASSVVHAEQALTGMCWALGMGLALWWTASIMLCVAAEQSGSNALQRLSDRVALPMARRMVSGTMALGLIGLPACGAPNNQPEMVLVESGAIVTPTTSISTDVAPSTTAVSSTTAPSTTVAPSATVSSTTASSTTPRSTVLTATTQVPTTLQSTTTSVDPGLALSDAPVPSAAQPAPAQRPEPYVVQPGDNLWSIAKSHLEQTEPNPTNAQIAPYWNELVQLARDSLRSGNPNLIYPGESIQMPPIPA